MINLNYRDSKPIYEQIREGIINLIVTGAMAAGDKLPSVRELAMQLAINPNTIQRAYTQLEQDVYLYTVSGRGNFVAPESEWREGKKCKMLEEWTLLTEKAREAGLTLAQLQETLMQVFGKEQA